MKQLILSMLVPCLAACSAVGYYHKNPQSGSETAMLLPSLLGEQAATDAEMTTPGGLKIKVAKYATHNPDRKLTELGKSAVFWSATVKMWERTAESVDLKAAGDNAVNLKSAPVGKDPNVIPVDPNLPAP